MSYNLTRIINNMNHVNDNNTQNITSTGANLTNVHGLVRIDEVVTDKVSSTLQSTHIELNESGVMINANVFLLNMVLKLQQSIIFHR